ncbi:hypothetical protein NP233_g64 [Leucocoprinus birnbaumii]|uniref:Uncharacterized protein n=1 Tax=Leucocoprinus birnbaumii TaxID=56174 RepID=A0AAD5Z0J7_9AGAR|nr:hypothetical protein NP233_g64 [Leucocoprinus birnbaumii]
MPTNMVTMPVVVGTEGDAILMAVTRGQVRRQAEGTSRARTFKISSSIPPKDRMKGGNEQDTPKASGKQRMSNTSNANPNATHQNESVQETVTKSTNEHTSKNASPNLAIRIPARNGEERTTCQETKTRKNSHGLFQAKASKFHGSEHWRKAALWDFLPRRLWAITETNVEWSRFADPFPEPPDLPFDHPVNKTINENRSLFRIVTPVNTSLFRQLLIDHPSDVFAESVCDGLERSFWPCADAHPRDL